MNPFHWFKRKPLREEMATSLEVTLRLEFIRPVPMSVASSIAAVLVNRFDDPAAATVYINDPRIGEETTIAKSFYGTRIYGNDRP